ncbi:MAG: pyrroloquinoline quinone biosynthesis protein PqqB [Candidatus Binatus sp.]|uniref:pyrroloquinoline quinone biosynthesis protein PqqB n=1 Tax=Candidatus Binatus sp. TaxID=2811406 RepID=UPI003BB1EDA9
MRVHILGSAAGGGFPQWNCNCVNCAGLRTGVLHAKARTQCSVAVSADGSRWSLLNASPDLRAQIFSFPELLPKSRVRGSAIDAVLLSDAELDHIAGLLSLREAQPIRLYCTPRVFEWVFATNPIFAALNQSDRFNVTRLEDRKAETVGCGFGFETIFVSGKVPTYVKTPTANCDGAVVAYKLIDKSSASSLLYVPAIKEIDERFIADAAKCDCLLFDGSFWSENEMDGRGTGTRTASEMGHIAISGPAGSLARLSHLRIRKIYTHINNTNPILDETSAERREIERAGWEVAEDGMDFTV